MRRAEIDKARECYAVNEIETIVSTVFNINDQINFLWNFYVVAIAVLLGWIFTTGIDWTVEKRRSILLLYVIFAVVNGTALYEAYYLLEKALIDLEGYVSATGTGSPFLLELIGFGGYGPVGAMIIHVSADVLIIGMIIRNTRNSTGRQG